jgi:hypothetical protein
MSFEVVTMRVRSGLKAAVFTCRTQHAPSPPSNVLNFIFGELRPRIATKINGLAGLVTS